MPKEKSEIQLGFQFPEYEFTEGDIVQYHRHADASTIPWVITKRIFYDQRSYEERLTEHGDISDVRTGWYYVIQTLFPRKDGWYDKDATHTKWLRLWKWKLEKQWEV